MKNYTFITVLLTTVLLYACSQNDNEFQTEENGFKSDSKKPVLIVEDLYIISLEHKKQKCQDSILNLNDETTRSKGGSETGILVNYCSKKYDNLIEKYLKKVDNSEINPAYLQSINIGEIELSGPCPEFICPIKVSNRGEFVFVTEFDDFVGHVTNHKGEVIGEFEVTGVFDEQFLSATMHLNRDLETSIIGNINFLLQTGDEISNITIDDAIIYP